MAASTRTQTQCTSKSQINNNKITFRFHCMSPIVRCDGSSDRSFMVDPLGYFSFQPVLHDWCNKGCGMSGMCIVCLLAYLRPSLVRITTLGRVCMPHLVSVNKFRHEISHIKTTSTALPFFKMPPPPPTGPRWSLDLSRFPACVLPWHFWQFPCLYVLS